MSVKRLIPETFVGQLLAMLVVVLLITQFVNLLLLIGFKSLQERSIVYNNAVETTARYISELPNPIPEELPYVVNENVTSESGVFFVSNVDRANRMKEAKALSRYNRRFESKLEEYGLNVLKTHVSLLESDTRFLQNREPRPDSLGLEKKRTRKLSDKGQGQDAMPRTYRKDDQFQFNNDGLYHPPRKPSRDKFGSRDRRGNPQIRISAELEEGIFFNAMIPHRRTESFTGRILLSTLLLLSSTLLSIWVFTKRISRPLSNITDAAERFGRGEIPERLDQTGPKDIRQAAIAFNEMQSRLTQMLDTQRTMLRAVGHDLRTPLTSLRIRAENIAEDRDRDKFVATLNDMNVMTEEILSWAQDVSGIEELANVDLEALIASVVDDYKDQGKDVHLENFESLILRIRRVSIKRVFQNLLNNALDYGQSANISVQLDGSEVLIHIDDCGAGVSEDELEHMSKPFVRLEESRSKKTGGRGLGLSIAEAIVQIHGGQIDLSNRKPNGLRATIRLPYQT